MYTILYDFNDGGWKLTAKTLSNLTDAKKAVDEMSKTIRCRNVRLLQDVVEDPYKDLYQQLYKDFVIGNRQTPTDPTETRSVTIIE